MPDLQTVKYGLFAVHDSGAPAGKDGGYITLVLLHGYTWYSPVFSRMLPFASKYNARIVLVNRRDYPGSTPFSDAERKLLSLGSEPTPEGSAALGLYLKDRARDLHDFLEQFIAAEKIPAVQNGAGGIILAAWSLGVIFTTSILAHASSFPVGDVNVAAHLRCVLNHDAPYGSLGYPPLKDGYHPHKDETISSEERINSFSSWVSGYFKHGESSSELETRAWLPEPPPTITTMTAEDIQSALYQPVEDSDIVFVGSGTEYGTLGETREAAYFPLESSTSDWGNVTLRHIWCEHSIWEIPWATYCMKAEFEEAKKAGRRVRPHEIVRMRGANHFIHWDQPERTLRVLLGDNAAAENTLNP